MISVIIPAYHCAGTINRAIDSVLCQGVNTEILVIDDCSGDGLKQICGAYKNPAVRYIRNEKNLGAAMSRNKGVALAKGEYVAFLDADDWWEKDKLAKQLQRMEETGCDFCCTARELVDGSGAPTGRIIPVKELISYRDILHQNMINCSSVLMRADLAKRYKMEHEDSHEDYILWMKILRDIQTACAVNEPLLKYTLSSTGKSGSKLKSAGMTFKAYRYAGYGLVSSAWYFCSYAVHGFWKYFRSYFGGNRS